MRNRVLLAVSALVLASLACGTYVPTPTPTAAPTNTPQPAAVSIPPTETAVPTATSTSGATVATVAQALVNVRSEPNGAVVASLEAGQTVEVVECADSWCKIADPAGWVWQGCLTNNPDGLKCEAK